MDENVIVPVDSTFLNLLIFLILKFIGHKYLIKFHFLLPEKITEKYISDNVSFYFINMTFQMQTRLPYNMRLVQKVQKCKGGKSLIGMQKS